MVRWYERNLRRCNRSKKNFRKIIVIGQIIGCGQINSFMCIESVIRSISIFNKLLLTAIHDVRITSRRSWYCQFRGHLIITPSLGTIHIHAPSGIPTWVSAVWLFLKIAKLPCNQTTYIILILILKSKNKLNFLYIIVIFKARVLAFSIVDFNLYCN